MWDFRKWRYETRRIKKSSLILLIKMIILLIIRCFPRASFLKQSIYRLWNKENTSWLPSLNFYYCYTIFVQYYFSRSNFYHDNFYNITLSSKSVKEPSNSLEKKTQTLFTIQNQFITPHGCSLPFRAYNETSRERIEGALTWWKSASAKFKAQGGYLCIDKSTPREWHGERSLVAKWFSVASRRKRYEKAPRTRSGTREASGNREVVGAKVFASDENFTNCVLMGHDWSTFFYERQGLLHTAWQISNFCLKTERNWDNGNKMSL